MARFRLPFGSKPEEKHAVDPGQPKSDEKQAVDSPTEEVGRSHEAAEGIVDEDQDDLHREMKPRQLSTCRPSRPARSPVRLLTRKQTW